MDFSGIIKITDLNDFLNPSENCSVHNNMIHKSTENTAKVSLSDCLACSGCVTSAETVLLSQQSVETLHSHLSSNVPITMSLSQQSLISLSNHLSIPLSTLSRQIAFALRSKGINRVLPMTSTRDIILESAYQEFKQRLSNNTLPVLSSECPGWLCFALKKGDEKLVPLMSKCKTPMLAQREIYSVEGFHVAVMPCYDKKLEGVMDEGVDLVLTTTELLEFCSELSEESEFPEFFSSVVLKSSSLGYAEYVLNRAVKELYGEDFTPEFRPTRRRDVIEAEYKDLRFCIATGFQNIQNLIREIKTGKCRYSYIEIMACPMGCLNGGGQFRSSREEVTRIEAETSKFFKKSENLEVLGNLRELKLLNTNKLKW